MQEDWIVFTKFCQRGMGCAAITHEIFGVDFEETNAIIIPQNIAEMFVLEPGTSFQWCRENGQAKPRQSLTRKVDHMLRLPRFCD